jgi:hypothetical protein
MSSVYEIIKQHFLGLAKILEKGHSPPVLINNPNAVIILMPSGAALYRERNLIEGVLEGLYTHLNQYSDWKLARVISADKSEFMIVLYLPNTFSLQDVLQERSKMKQLNYTEAELKDN